MWTSGRAACSSIPGNVGTLLRAEGILKVEVYSFFALEWRVRIREESQPHDHSNDGTTPETVPVEVLTLGAAGASAFVGVGGQPDHPGASGLSLSGVDLGLAFLKRQAPAAPVVATDLRSG